MAKKARESAGKWGKTRGSRRTLRAAAGRFALSWTLLEEIVPSLSLTALASADLIHPGFPGIVAFLAHGIFGVLGTIANDQLAIVRQDEHFNRRLLGDL